MTDNGDMPPNVKDLLLASRLEREEVNQLLAPYGLKDTAKADANLQDIATDPSDRQLLADVLDQLLAVVAQSADPDQALIGRPCCYPELASNGAGSRKRRTTFSVMRETLLL